MKLHAKVEFRDAHNHTTGSVAFPVGGRWVTSCETAAMRTVEQEYPYTLRDSHSLLITLTDSQGTLVRTLLWVLVPNPLAFPKPSWLTEPVTS